MDARQATYPAPHQMLSWRTRRQIKSIVVHVLGIGVTAVMVAPLLWLVTTSIRPLEDVITSPPTIIPTRFSVQGYIDMWTTAPFFHYVVNSTVVSASVTVIVLFISSLAAYGLTRFRFPGEKLLLTAILVSQALPGASILLPVFKTLVNLGLIDTRLGLILIYTGFFTPFCTWLLVGYFRSIPVELSDAGLVDGLSHIQVLFRIVVPLSAPAMVATAIFTFLAAWNEFLFALVLTRDNSATVPVGIFTQYFAQYVNLWNQVAAASIIISLPPVVLFLVIQRQFIGGLTAGAVKG